MNRQARIGIAAAMLLALATGSAWAGGGRTVRSFDNDWRFHLGNVPGADKPDLDDSAWRKLNVPHDWSIEGPVGSDPAAMSGPFDRKSPAGGGGGYLNGGTGWYRKTFTVPEAAKGQRLFLQFDGVYMDSDMWLNGQPLGKHPYGYTGFEYDITPHVKFGAPNVLAVRVVVLQPCSRWYSGAGIFRHTRLVTTDAVRVPQWGTYVTTPEVSDTQAAVRVRTKVRNDGPSEANVTIRSAILPPAPGAAAGQAQEATHAIPAGGEFEFDQTFKVENPSRWSIETPVLYTVGTRVTVGGQAVDEYATPFGIRTIEFTADKGFFLNGRRVPIQGVCNHHDLGCLGSAVHVRALERQLEILKAMGCNGIRTSHNPPTPELLDLCDRMGFVVMDEAFDEWRASKTRNGYGRFFDQWSEKDIVSMIHRDRNHPSVVLWSIGNEIHEQGDKGGEKAKRLAAFCHREDPTRPVTSACNNVGGAAKSGYADALDVFGINYHIDAYKTYKGKVMVASETASALSTRGEYGLTLNKKGQVEIKVRPDNQCTSYDKDKPGWGHTAETDLTALKNSPWVAGEFVWTGFDYIGEPTPYKWPSRSSYFGIVDLAGFPKDRYYIYQSQWTDKPMVHLLPHWNWPQLAGKEIPVWCYSNAESVELLLNGKSLGEKKLATDGKGLHLEWSVPYAPGTLTALAKKEGQVVAKDEVRTAGAPAKLVARADRMQIRPDGDDLSFVTVRVEDAQGNLCPDADNKIAFSIQGPGVIAGLDNGDPINLEPFQGKTHKAFHGLALAVIEAAQPGEIQLTAAAEGLAPCTVTLTAK